MGLTKEELWKKFLELKEKFIKLEYVDITFFLDRGIKKKEQKKEYFCLGDDWENIYQQYREDIRPAEASDNYLRLLTLHKDSEVGHFVRHYSGSFDEQCYGFFPGNRLQMFDAGRIESIEEASLEEVLGHLQMIDTEFDKEIDLTCVHTEDEKNNLALLTREQYNLQRMKKVVEDIRETWSPKLFFSYMRKETETNEFSPQTNVFLVLGNYYSMEGGSSIYYGPNYMMRYETLRIEPGVIREQPLRSILPEMCPNGFGRLTLEIELSGNDKWKLCPCPGLAYEPPPYYIIEIPEKGIKYLEPGVTLSLTLRNN